jgi:2-polyprenyl-3-methyl-5-hydroxy-6-metoxy-1,4-benzoquinol methylase
LKYIVIGYDDTFKNPGDTNGMNTTCIICGDKLEPWKKAGLLFCKNCYFVTTDLDMGDDELRKLYSAEYFNGQEYSDYLGDKKLIQKNCHNKLKTLKKYISAPYNEKKLFEIGCAYGFFLDVARNEFTGVKGIDISNDAIRFARENLKLDVISGDYLSIPATKADIFCLWDTVEHLKNPELFIEKISKEVNDGGLIALSTGDISSINAKLWGPNWRQIHPPTHLHYFSRRALTKLLTNYGFEIIHTSYPGQFIRLDTVAYILLVLKRNWKWLYDIIKKTGILKLWVYINLFDTIYIIGRKSTANL